MNQYKQYLEIGDNKAIQVQLIKMNKRKKELSKYIYKKQNKH